eukprot:2569709-Rhodomonas_salina.2
MSQRKGQNPQPFQVNSRPSKVNPRPPPLIPEQLHVLVVVVRVRAWQYRAHASQYNETLPGAATPVQTRTTIPSLTTRLRMIIQWWSGTGRTWPPDAEAHL